MQHHNHIHFIGICGVAMGALALAFQKNGWTVTGSDKGFYPPISTHLKEAGVNYYPGWHPEKMGRPDVVVVGNVAGSSNPEWLFVQEHNIPYLSYPEAIAKYFIAPTSIVCAGTYGKTTSSTILSWIAQECGLKESHMFGGLAVNELPAARITDSPDISIVEGDEYKSSRWDTGAKFFHYSPTHLLLTSAVWDHADVYPTEASYYAAFQKLLDGMSEDGLRIVSEKVIKDKKIDAGRAITYGASDDNDYQYTDVSMTKEGISFSIVHGADTFEISASILGTYNADNMTGCFAMAHQIGIEPEKIVAALGKFQGVKRRLERRHHGTIDVYDDIAHSPQKAVAVLKSISELYSGKVIAVFEPNTGNRTIESIPGYDHAFSSADEVIIPRLTRVKVAADDPNPPFDGERLGEIIGKTHDETRYIPDDDALVSHLTTESKVGDVIVFLGSHGFRGMIEEVVSRLESEKVANK